MLASRHDEVLPERLRRSAPLVWALLLLGAMPFLGLEWRGWAIYPGHWLLSGVLLWLFLRRSGGRELPLKLPLVLVVYLGTVAALRGQWSVAGLLSGSLLLNYPWGWAAWRLGAGRGTGSAGRGLLLGGGWCLLLGGLGWALAYGWPTGCVLISCPVPELPPYPFLGGWRNQGQYLLFLLLLLPLWGGCALVLEQRSPGQRVLAGGVLFMVLASLAAGAHWWMLLLGGLGVAGVAVQGGRSRRARGLLKGLGLACAVGALLLYGLFPGYLSMAARGEGSGALLRIVYPLPPPVRLSSQQDTPIPLELVNAGVVPLGGEGQSWLKAKLVMTPAGEQTRVYELGRYPLSEVLSPGRSQNMAPQVRPPHWAREGYLGWELESRLPARLSGDSQVGFRFINRDYRDLAQEKSNFLSAMAGRSRDFGGQTGALPTRSAENMQHVNLISRSLDVLIFSPLWGLIPVGPEWRYPLASPGPFWLHLFQEYGAIGLALALWMGLRMFQWSRRMAAQSGQRAEQMLWRLVPWSTALVLGTGLFSREMGTFHGMWGLLMLYGFCEGRYRLAFGQRLAPARLPLRWRIPLPGMKRQGKRGGMRWWSLRGRKGAVRQRRPFRRMRR